MADGKTLKEIDIPETAVHPHFGGVINFDISDISLEPATEYFLKLQAATTEEQGVVPAGHVVAREQIKLPWKTENQPESPTIETNVEMEESPENYTFEAGRTIIVISKENGRIVSYRHKNNELLTEAGGPDPDFWRAPTDNDFGNGMPQRNINWKKVTKNHPLKEMTVEETENGSYRMNVTWDLSATGNQFHTTYTIKADGSVHLNNQLEASSSEASDIPRVGMVMQLPREFDQLTWFGKGPWENYTDRNTSSFVGLYSDDVAEQMVPYVRPQENGNKTDVRWAALTNDKGEGLLAVSHQHPEEGFEMTAMPYLTADFDAREGYEYGPVHEEQKHITFVEERDLVRWNIDYGQRGLGGDNSWGARPQEEYQIMPDQAHEYSFTLVPVSDSSREALIQKSKQYGNM